MTFTEPQSSATAAGPRCAERRAKVLGDIIVAALGTLNTRSAAIFSGDLKTCLCQKVKAGKKIRSAARPEGGGRIEDLNRNHVVEKAPPIGN